MSHIAELTDMLHEAELKLQEELNNAHAHTQRDLDKLKAHYEGRLKTIHELDLILAQGVDRSINYR